MKVAVVGTGNSGCAHACMLVKHGHDVSLIKTSTQIHNENFEVIKKNGGIYCVDTTISNNKKTFYPVGKITTDIKDGLSGVDCILILTQSLQHESLAKKIGPFLRKGQIVLIVPGNLGSIHFANHSEKGVIFAEGESTSFDARISDPGEVHILFKNVRNALAFLNKNEQCYLTKANELFDSYKYLRTNVIESAMHNPNLVVHTIGTIMSASRIEYCKGEFWMYRESFSPSVWNLIHDLDAEKNAVIKKYGGNELAYLDACKWRNEIDLSVDSLKVFQNYAAFGGPKGPASLDTRYINEDVPMDLCTLELLAKFVNIDTPVTSSLINLASSLRRINYREQAQDITKIDLKKYNLFPYC